MVIHSSFSHFINSFSNYILSSFSMPGPVLKCQVTDRVPFQSLPQRSSQSSGELSDSKMTITTKHDHGHNTGKEGGHRNEERADVREGSVRGNTVYMEDGRMHRNLPVGQGHPSPGRARASVKAESVCTFRVIHRGSEEEH